MSTFYVLNDQEFEVKIDDLYNIIRSNMHRVIMDDLTDCRLYDGFVPYTAEQVNNFIHENRARIEEAVILMFSWYEDECRIHRLISDDLELGDFADYLYDFVDTGRVPSRAIDEYDDDGYDEEDPFDRHR